MIPLLAVNAMARILAGKDLRSLSWIAVIAVCIILKEAFLGIVMFINQIHIKLAHRRPQFIEILSISVRT